MLSIAIFLISPPRIQALELLAYWDFNDPADSAASADVTGNTPDLQFFGNAMYSDDEGGLSETAGDYALELGGFNDGSLI